ncbi:helix-turn-helix domain-containing protein [uncultured Flavobacterium sp.]|uniref:helix-turn-helix domain-containing protein n=1 Tax=uncultured Flavobacterium sp. TaxID=165435 RepID=UPI0030ED00EB|tara:strand:+ start:31941 stop:32819 length:879 start_codon:yes stop_codon:yes gene_type:complete
MAQNQQQIKNIYQMLFEIATGNLSYRITEESESHEVNEVAKTLNNLAEKLQQIILENGYVNPHYTYQNLVQITIILNSDYQIISFSPNLPNFLNSKTKDLINSDFINLLSQKSIPLWKKIKEEVNNDDQYHNTIQLILIDNQKQLVPTFCTVYRLYFSNNIFISSVTTILQDITTDSSKAIPRKSDAVIIQEVYEYIMSHLEEPLPTLKELSHIFGTNEFKLKDGFRHFFNTSIYRFYTEQRLKQAHALILQTNLPLKEIAFMSGFNDYTNFSKAFKKQYHYPPSDLKRNKE